MESDWYKIVIPIVTISGVGLIGLIWRNMRIEVDKKLDKELYNETIGHIQNAVEGINGTAKELKGLAADITKIQNDFITRKEFDYELRLHHSECPAIKEIAKLLEKRDEILR